MNKAIKTTLRIGILAILIIPFMLILLVRFTGGTISGGDKIILGYDEDKGRFQFFEQKSYHLNGIDGPYIIRDTIIRITKDNKIQKELLNQDSILVLVQNIDMDSFYVNIRNENQTPLHEYQMPSKLITISDIEGNFDGFSSFLQANKIIDDHFNWIFGDGHLVLLGDFVDRGENVIATLWLIYKLEIEAEKSGGKVHFILGNHEIMNIQGNFKYAKDKYKKIATEIGGLDEPKENYKILFSENSFLGRWLRTKNIIEKIGEYIFVHAGLSPEILPQNLEIEEMNKEVRQNIDQNLYNNPNDNKKASFLMGPKSPFWYRGLVSDHKDYLKITHDELSDVLLRYKASHMVIGHTIVDDVSKDFDGKVIRIDVKHGQEKYSKETKGILIEDGKIMAVDGIGTRFEM